VNGEVDAGVDSEGIERVIGVLDTGAPIIAGCDAMDQKALPYILFASASDDVHIRNVRVLVRSSHMVATVPCSGRPR
jgi:hypothetical protein